jgi:vanillate O-demethylase monooxygenase subunit
MFIQNTWYVACQSHELSDKPLGRKVCNESIAFFRGPENQAAAVQDFCPHRGAP